MGSILGADGRVLSSMNEELLWYMMFKLYAGQEAKSRGRYDMHDRSLAYVIKRYNNFVTSQGWPNHYLLQYE